MKSVVILWSGGLDSTYLIVDYLEKGYKVEACYIEMKNNEFQNKLQLLAIESMLPYFEKWYPCQFHYSFLTSILINVPNYGTKSFEQVPIIFMSAIYAFGQNTDEVAIGYTMNDDAISYLPELNNLWNSLMEFCYIKPKLKFPLIKKNKQWIYASLPEELKDKIWYCEKPSSLNEPCGSCSSCKRMEGLERSFKLPILGENNNEI